MRVGVIGAGHAGVEAAAAAAAVGASVTLFSAEPVLPYFRPRLVAVAFGQVTSEAIRMHPAQWYLDRGTTLRLDSRVAAFNAKKLSVIAGGEEQVFDGIVLATGMGPILPGFASGDVDRVLPLWTIDHADRIRARLRPGAQVVVVGGGAIGIEAALMAVSAGMRAVIIEKADGLMAGRLAPAASRALLGRLSEKGIRVLADTAVMQTETLGDGRVLIKTDHGESVKAALAILCIGARSDVGLAQRAGLATGAGVIVDSRFQTSMPSVFACGDITNVAGSMTRTAGEAVAQGRIAGANLCAVLSGKAREMREYARSTDTISLKVEDFELHIAGRPASPPGSSGAGRPASPDCEVRMLEGSDAGTCRLLIMKDGKTMGVQMVGTNRDFRKYVEAIADGWSRGR